jgi:lysylphosphatidylglycerol synthetase-like protein (DUF2156 family)
MDNTGRVPVSVNYAAGLCGLFAGVQAFSVVNFLAQGKVAYAGASLLVGLVFLALMWGLRRGNRAAWIGAMIFSGLILVFGLAMIASEGWVGLAFVVPGLLLLSLVLLPAGARRHFAGMTRASA